MKQRLRFIHKEKTDFFVVLKQRVDGYFTENNISQHADGRMIFKTVFMLAFYYIPFVAIVSGLATGPFFWLSWVLSGLGLAGIGMSVMHDANHGAYSSKQSVNNFVGHVLSLVGGDPNNWKVQHNILHHTYTNIHGHDEDVDDKLAMRFSPHGRYRKGIQFQMIYAFLLYSILTLYWATAKDFVQFARYKKLGHIRDSRSERIKKFSFMVASKLFYFTYMLIIPIAVFGLSWSQMVLGFLLMHVVSGLVLSIVFQLAHVVENTEFPVPNEKGNIESDWAIHQLKTTADFSANNPLITFYVGGLNYQVIHHLFPRVCHVHYPKLAPIVAKTAEEYGVPYLYFPTFGEAFTSHVKMLRKLGRKEIHHMFEEM